MHFCEKGPAQEENSMSATTEIRPQTSGRKNVRSEDKLLLSRREAAELLSISPRSLDYLIAGSILQVRRIGSRVLIPTEALQRFIRADHPRKIAL
jgi:excisionase family DNA binding protein